MLLAQLAARFGPVPAEAKARVMAASEAALARWSLRVLTASTLTGVLGGPAKSATAPKPPARRPAARKGARAR